MCACVWGGLWAEHVWPGVACVWRACVMGGRCARVLCLVCCVRVVCVCVRVRHVYECVCVCVCFAKCVRRACDVVRRACVVVRCACIVNASCARLCLHVVCVCVCACVLCLCVCMYVRARASCRCIVCVCHVSDVSGVMCRGCV